MPATTRAHARARAFTLIELIAVIVIIAVLAGIAAASYRTIIGHSHQAASATTAHQAARLIQSESAARDTALETWAALTADPDGPGPRRSVTAILDEELPDATFTDAEATDPDTGAHLIHVTRHDHATLLALSPHTAGTPRVLTTDTPTTGDTADPEDTGGGDVAAPARSDFPTPATTGVPTGTTLTPSGSRTVTKEGAVLDGLDITGTVTISADNVTIRNTRIRNTRIRNTGTYPVRVLSGYRDLVIEDSEIDGRARGAAAVAFSHYTLRRVHIHNVTEGPRIAGGHVTIEDSLVHRLVQDGDNHTDALQIVSGRNNINIRRNALEVNNPDTGLLGNAAFQFGEEEGPVGNCLVEGNYLNGGNYTINGGGGSTTGAACTFRDNVLGRDHRYGAVANLGPNSSWDPTNIWLDTATPVAYG